jgi:hypothetical protein
MSSAPDLAASSSPLEKASPTSPEKRNVRDSFQRILHWSRHANEEGNPAASERSEKPSSLSPSEATAIDEPEQSISSPSSPAANDSKRRSHVFQLKPKNKRLSSSHKNDNPAEPALEGEPIASRHKLGTASIEGDFHKIEYGQFKQRPACLIIVDLRLVYQPDNTIRKMKIEFQFGNDGAQTSSDKDFGEKTTQMNKSPISKYFMPHELKGRTEYSNVTKHSHIKPSLGALGFKATAGGGGQSIATIKQDRWHVQGRTEQHDGTYDTFGWNIFENVASMDSVPRKLRLGMIAFHEHQRFWVRVAVDGSLRQMHFPLKDTKEKRWFDPPSPEDVGNHLLSEQMLENYVDRENLLIPDIGQDRPGQQPSVTLIDFSEIGGRVEGGEYDNRISDLMSVTDGEGALSEVDTVSPN